MATARPRPRPCATKLSRRTSAQPSTSSRSRSTSAPVCSKKTQNSTVGPAPEIVAPSAPRSRRALDQLHRARIEVRARRGWWRRSSQAARDQRQVAAREAEREHRGVRDVEGRIGERHLGRQRGARLAGRHRLRRDHRDRLEPGRRLDHGHVAVGADHEAAVERGGDVVGMPLDRGLRARTPPRARSASSYMWSAATSAATIAAPLDPRPAASGISERIAEACRSVDRVQVGERPHAEVASRPPAASIAGVDRELARLLDLQLEVQRDRRGHRVEAGAEVRRRAGHAHPAAAAHQAEHRPLDLARAPGRTGSPRGAARARSPGPSARVRSARTRAGAPSGGMLQHARDAGGRRRLAEDALVGGEPALRVEDLVVADRLDPRRRTPRAPATASCQRAGLPIRIAEATVSGLLDRPAEHDRRGALGLEAVEARPALAVLARSPSTRP